MNILITAVGGDVGSSMAHCLKRSDLEIERIIGCDINPDNSGLPYIDIFRLVPAWSEEGYVARLVEICLEESVEVICPSSERDIELIDGSRELFGSRGIKLLINERKVLAAFSGKLKTSVYLESIGINVPRTWRPNYDDRITCFPVVVKGDFGCGSRDVVVANGEKEYKEALRRISNPICQQFVGTIDEEYTICVFSDGEYVESVGFRRKLGSQGGSVFVEYSDDPGIGEMAEIVAQQLNLRGSINLQARKVGSQFFVFEVNPRISSTVGFRDRLGFRDLVWWIKMLDEGHVDILFSRPDTTIRGVRYLDEHLYDETGAPWVPKPQCIDA